MQAASVGRKVAVVLAIAGVAVLVYPLLTHLWAWWTQNRLDDAFDRDRYRLGLLHDGEPLTRLEIPRLGVDHIIVEGTSPEALRTGTGHYPNTPYPGQRGNVAIAGHRTTYQKPFNRIDELVPGDRIILTTPIGRHVYRVRRPPWVVAYNDWSVIEKYPKRGRWLTLTSCHPEGSDDYRIVARAKLASSTGAIAIEKPRRSRPAA